MAPLGATGRHQGAVQGRRGTRWEPDAIDKRARADVRATGCRGSMLPLARAAARAGMGVKQADNYLQRVKARVKRLGMRLAEQI